MRYDDAINLLAVHQLVATSGIFLGRGLWKAVGEQGVDFAYISSVLFGDTHCSNCFRDVVERLVNLYRSYKIETLA